MQPWVVADYCNIHGLFNALLAGTSVSSVMDINKFASANGTLMATIQFVRRLLVLWRMLLPPQRVLAFVFSYRVPCPLSG